MNDNVLDFNKLLRGGDMKPFDFPTAINKLIDGKKIQRLDWKDKKEHGMVKDGWLMIYRNDKYHIWKVNDGDLTGKDWVEMGEVKK